MKRKATPPKDEDNGWKELLDRHFEGCLEFFFPRVHVEIDWTRSPVFLDKELPRLAARHERKDRRADKLAKVWRKDGNALCVLVHTEIQGQPEPEFDERMFEYNYRGRDRLRCPVVSLAVITGSAGRLKLGRYEAKLWGCRVVFEYPVVNFSTWRGREAELAASDNPLALVVLAELRVRWARHDPRRKYAVKRELTLLLYEHGYTEEYRISLLRFLDWLIRLAAVDEQRLDDDLAASIGEKIMPYVTHWERRGREEGMLDIVLRQLRKKLGALDAELKAQVERLSATRLKQLSEALLDFTQSADLEMWLKRKAV